MTAKDLGRERVIESRLQRYIVESHKRLLPGLADGPTAVAEEVPIPHDGPADVLVVDSEGMITLVECKLVRNKEARRPVVGQALGYAAHLWKLDLRQFEKRFNKSQELMKARRGGDWTRLQELPDVSGALSRNLKSGHFRIVVVTDQINDWIRQTVVYLNSVTLPEVDCFAISIDPALGELIQLVGQSPDEVGPYTPRWKGPRRKILRKADNADQAIAAAGLLHWAADRDPAVKISFDDKQGQGLGVIKAKGCILFRIVRGRDVKVSFTAFGKCDNEVRQEHIARLRTDLAQIDPRFERGKRPVAPLEILAYEDKRQDFLGLMERNLKVAADHSRSSRSVSR